MKTGTMSSIGMILTLAIISISFLGPWYNVNLSSSHLIESEADIDIYLTELKIRYAGIGEYETQSIKYNEINQYSDELPGLIPEGFEMMNNIMIITFISLISAILSLLGIIAYTFNIGTISLMKKIGIIFGIITIITTLIASIYFFTGGFVEGETGFWFIQNFLGLEMTGGPTYGWYLILIAAVISTFATTTLIKSKTEKA